MMCAVQKKRKSFSVRDLQSRAMIGGFVNHEVTNNEQKFDVHKHRVHRTLFICGSTCRRAEHVEQRDVFILLSALSSM